MADRTFYVTVGLEIHAELKTQTKMFCACKNDPDEEEPNKNICPVCMAHPGALPVPNKMAIQGVIKVGLALQGTIADFTEFDRKNYFYPDIPKGYQISQYKYPIVSGGHLARFDITRIHLEEDTATNKHFPQVSLGGVSPKTDLGEGYSLIDFNRAGVPLMELVTEPHTFESVEEAAKQAAAFAKELQLILWYLDVSEANMEKGEMRVEANISITTDPKILGTKVEVKNLNSFRSVERAIKYEIDRMRKLTEGGKGGDIVQETRGWNEGKLATYSQRKKESSHDYRYFPEPDLPKMMLHEAFDLEKMKKELPELPESMRARFASYGIRKEDADILVAEPELGLEFEGTLACFPELFEKEKPYDSRYAVAIANFTLSDIQAIVKKDSGLGLANCEQLAVLIREFVNGRISSRVVKDMIHSLIYERGKYNSAEDVQKVLEQEGLIQKNDAEELKNLAKKIIDSNAKVVADYKSGKENALMSLVGQMMKETKGSANPQVAKKLLEELLARP